MAGSTGRADEVRSGVGLGSGAIHITCLVKHSFVRQQFDRQTFGVCVQRSSAVPTHFDTLYYYDKRSVWSDFPGNAHHTLDGVQPHLSYQRDNRCHTLCRNTPPASHPQGWHATRRQASSSGGKTSRGEVPLKKNLTG